MNGNGDGEDKVKPLICDRCGDSMTSPTGNSYIGALLEVEWVPGETDYIVNRLLERYGKTQLNICVLCFFQTMMGR